MTALYAHLMAAGISLAVIALAFYAVWYVCQIHDATK
jgi:hypothetical protein